MFNEIKEVNEEVKLNDFQDKDKQNKYTESN